MDILTSLIFGGEDICSLNNDGSIAVVHACKDPCHRRAVGYNERSLPSSHQNYLFLEQDYHLFLNMIDPPVPLFQRETFVVALNFIDRHIKNRQVLVHCNLGQSRAPSIALLYFAKRAHSITNESYAAAAQEFTKKYAYYPSFGISSWLAQNWSYIN